MHFNESGTVCQYIFILCVCIVFFVFSFIVPMIMNKLLYHILHNKILFMHYYQTTDCLNIYIYIYIYIYRIDVPVTGPR